MNQRLKYFAAVSLLLNVVLAGVITGQAGRAAIATHSPMDEIAISLPEDKRALLQTALQKAEADVADQRSQMNETRKRAAALMAAEPFDRKAYLAELGKLYEQRAPVWKRISEAVADVAEQCSPEERDALATILRRPRTPLASSPVFRNHQ